MSDRMRDTTQLTPSDDEQGNNNSNNRSNSTGGVHVIGLGFSCLKSDNGLQSEYWRAATSSLSTMED
eukprot:jgi/Psemu1/35148/gm1.35148_g